jgi:hypothetical protein
MIRIGLFLLAVCTLGAADNPWLSVQHLKSRQELRVYKKGSSEPVNAVFADANEDRLIVVVKNKEVAIPRQEIDRIDARPAAKTPVTRETTEKTVDPDYRPRPPHGDDVPGSSVGSNISFGGKGAFETIYRRPPGAAK